MLFLSVREGWGIPITEAGVVGTPSIVFDSTGIRDAIDNGKAGYLCETNDVEGLVEQIKKQFQTMRDMRKCDEKHMNFLHNLGLIE